MVYIECRPGAQTYIGRADPGTSLIANLTREEGVSMKELAEPQAYAFLLFLLVLRQSTAR